MCGKAGVNGEHSLARGRGFARERQERSEVVDWYTTAEEATNALRDVLTDEPNWRVRMSVLEVGFAAGTA